MLSWFCYFSLPYLSFMTCIPMDLVFLVSSLDSNILFLNWPKVLPNIEFFVLQPVQLQVRSLRAIKEGDKCLGNWGLGQISSVDIKWQGKLEGPSGLVLVSSCILRRMIYSKRRKTHILIARAIPVVSQCVLNNLITIGVIVCCIDWPLLFLYCKVITLQTLNEP